MLDKSKFIATLKKLWVEIRNAGEEFSQLARDIWTFILLSGGPGTEERNREHSETNKKWKQKVNEIVKDLDHLLEEHEAIGSGDTLSDRRHLTPTKTLAMSPLAICNVCSLSPAGVRENGTVVVKRKDNNKWMEWGSEANVILKIIFDYSKQPIEKQAESLSYMQNSSLLTMKHDNLIKFFHCEAQQAATLNEPAKILLVMEYCELGDLNEYARRTVCNGDVIRDSSRQLVSVIAYIHQQRIVHRDIKGKNIMVTKRPDGTICLKLADLQDMAKKLFEITQPGELCQTVGTITHMAPEMVSAAYDGDTSTAGSKSDIWSLGITILEVIRKGMPPIMRQTNGEEFKVNHRAYFNLKRFFELDGRPEIPSNLSELGGKAAELASFIGRCLELEIGQRASAAELLDHPFIAG